MTRFRKNAVLILVVTFALCWGGQVSFADPQHFGVSHEHLEFTVEKPPEDGLIPDKNNTNVTVYRLEGHKGQDPVSYAVDHELAGLVYVSINGGEPQQLTRQGIKFMHKQERATLKFFLHPSVFWRGPGDYRVEVKSNGNNKAPTITLDIKIGKYAVITSVPKQVTIHATDGPDTYFSEPANITVQANHDKWRLDLTTEELQYEDPKVNASIKPSELLMAVVKEGEAGEYRPFEETRRRWTSSVAHVIMPGDCVLGSSGFYTATARFAAIIGWHHPAGTYNGKVYVHLVQD